MRCNSLLPGWTDTELLAGAKTHEKFVTATIGRTPGPPVGYDAARPRSAAHNLLLTCMPMSGLDIPVLWAGARVAQSLRETDLP